MAVITSNNRFLALGPCTGGDMWTSGLEYNGSAISGYSGSAFYQAPQTELSAGDKISVTETGNTAVISVTGLPSVDVEAPLYIVSDTTTGKTIGFSGDLTPDIDVINSTPGFVSGHCESGKFTLSGKDWGNDISGASANAASVGSGAAVNWVTDQGYITAQKEYAGVSPIVVNNTGNKISADTAVLTAQSPIYIETTTSGGVEVNTIKFSGDTGNTFTASMAADTVDYSGASAMRANFHNYGGRTAATSWGYFNSISLYPVGGNTSYGSTTFTIPDEFGYEGLIYRNGNQFRYLPYPFESAYHTSTSGLEMTGTNTKRTYFMSGPDTKFSINVPKHTTIELHYQGMMDVGNINSDTIMGFEFTRSDSTADTASTYLMATAEIVLPTVKKVTTAALGDTYNTYTAVDAPAYRRTYSTYMRYDNTSNYDRSLYMRVAPYIMGTQGWNTGSWLKIGQPQPYDNIYYKLIPDFD